MAFSGKRVLITGGAKGLGFELVKKFSAAKAEVFCLDKDELSLQNVKKQFPSAITIALDLLNWEATSEAVSKIGHVDHLVNNAGVHVGESFLEASSTSIDFLFGVNFKAMVNVSQVVAKAMIEKKNGGTIVNIASVRGQRPVPNSGMYGCSKAAIIMLTKSMAIELGEHNIRANCVCPTLMLTPLTRDFVENNPEEVKRCLNKQAIKRFAELSETADCVLFLSGPGSSMVTGEALGVDGGYKLQ